MFFVCLFFSYNYWLSGFSFVQNLIFCLQLEVANKYIDYHTKKFGYSKPNVNFVKGDIEKLGEAGLKDNSFDIIV